MPHNLWQSTSDMVAALVDAAAVALAVVVVDGTGRVVSWSREAERLFGLAAAAALGRDGIGALARFVNRTEVALLRGWMWAAEPWQGRLPVLTDAGPRLLYAAGRPLRDHTGGRVGAVLTFRDAAEVEAGERAVALVDTLLEESPVAVAMFDTDLRLARASPSFRGLHGRAEADLTGSLPQELFLRDAEAFEQCLRHVLDTGTPLRDLEFALPGEDPATHRWSASFYRLPSGPVVDRPPVGVGCVALDVTDRRERPGGEAARRMEVLRRVSHACGEVSWSDPDGADAERVVTAITGAPIPDFADEVHLYLTAPGSHAGRHLVVRLARASSRGVRFSPEAAPGPAPPLVDEVLSTQAGTVVPTEARGVWSPSVRAALCVPIPARGVPLGVLSFLRLRGGATYTPADTDFGLVLAAYLAVLLGPFGPAGV